MVQRKSTSPHFKEVRRQIGLAQKHSRMVTQPVSNRNLSTAPTFTRVCDIRTSSYKLNTLRNFERGFQKIL